jgi:diaminohydroxyphosphoribosylaminopyrimidine deaminase/5-amino-6-(5-phosphoribosylamino)uracil reductase
MVGAVVLDAQGTLRGEGAHLQPGTPHAEVLALQAAGQAARGGTIYVTLEPCRHVGRTPPCTDAILTAGIQRVCYGAADPWRQTGETSFPGGGALLAEAGLDVQGQVLAEACQELNEAFLWRARTGRPFVTVKLALTLDGRTATRGGHSQWLTGPGARQQVQAMRAEASVILSTVQTVHADQAQLTVRDPQILAMSGFQPPVRAILDRRGRLRPQTDRIFETLDDAPLWVYTARPVHFSQLQHPKFRCVAVPDTGTGLCLASVMDDLAAQPDVLSIWVEAGGRLAGALLREQYIQKLVLFYAPLILGDEAGHAAFAGGPLHCLADASRWRLGPATPLEGGELLVTAYPA